MKQYLDLLRHIKENGVIDEERTGTGAQAVFGYQMRFNLQQGFPLLTTKKLHLKSIIHELLWFLQGSTNIKYLKDNGVTIWDEWADEYGNLGPVYGKQWREWDNCEPIIPGGPHANKPIDQISWAINRLKINPKCRRIIVSAWNVADIPKMKLAPCHCLFQFYTRPVDVSKPDGQRFLSCQLYQRSCDTFLGVPYNIASYSLLTMMFAQCAGMIPHEFIWTGGNVHLYLNHMQQVDEQLSREPYPLPTMKINPNVNDIFGFKYEDFTLENYNCHPAIKAPIAV